MDIELGKFWKMTKYFN